MKSARIEELYRQQLSFAYRVGPRLGEGGYGITFLAREKLGKRRKVVLKLPNLDLARDRDDLKERLSEFNRSLDAEFEGMRRLRKVRCVAHVLGTSGCELELAGDCLRIPYIIQEFVPGENFDSYLESSSFEPYANVWNSRNGKPHSTFGGIKNPEVYFSLASKIIGAVAEVHRREVVHGDLWPQNIRINKGEPVIIDFGQSLLVDLAFASEGRPIEHKYAAPERRHSNGQWDTAADIYSLGGILFFMATGDPPPDPIEDREELKIKVCQLMKTYNPELYLANSGIADVVARCLRNDDSDRPAFAEGVLEELSIFLGSHRSSKLPQSMAFLSNATRRLEKGASEVFSHIASARIRTLARQFTEMSDGLYTLAGHNENIIRGMADCLSLLGKGDSYLTASVPSFWKPNPVGLGINGRFLEMNKVAAQRGVAIGRVFLIPEDEFRSEDVLKILHAHLRVIQELEERTPRVSTAKWTDPEKGHGYYVGVRKLDEDLRRRLDLTNFGVWSKSEENQDVLIVPQYREKDKDVAAIRMWAPVAAPKRIAKLKKQALEHIKESVPLREFLESLSRERRWERYRGDERVEIKVQINQGAKGCSGTLGPLRATVIDHSSRGLGLRMLTPLRSGELMRDGANVLLLPPCRFGETWARKFWGRDLRLRWASDPEHAPWKVGVEKR